MGLLGSTNAIGAIPTRRDARRHEAGHIRAERNLETSDRVEAGDCV